MNNLKLQPQVGDAVKVKNKLYVVLDIQQNRIFCREFQFNKTGQFKDYQDYNFPINACKKVNKKDAQWINQQRVKASIQRKPYATMRSNYVEHLVR